MTEIEPLTRTARDRLAANATAVQEHLGPADSERAWRISATRTLEPSAG